MTEAADIGNPDRKRVGFIGLGHMGSAMARRLVRGRLRRHGVEQDGRPR